VDDRENGILVACVWSLYCIEIVSPGVGSGWILAGHWDAEGLASSPLGDAGGELEASGGFGLAVRGEGPERPITGRNNDQRINPVNKAVKVAIAGQKCGLRVDASKICKSASILFTSSWGWV
jgi:hypothetical protein